MSRHKIERVHIPAWQTVATCTSCGNAIHTLEDFQLVCGGNKGKAKHKYIYMLETSRMWFQISVVQCLFSSQSNLIYSNHPDLSTLRSYGVNETHKRVRFASENGTQAKVYAINFMDIWTIHHHLPLFIDGKRMSLQNLWVRLTQLELFEHATKPNHRRKNAIFYHWRAENEIRQDVCYVVDPLRA